MEDKLAEYRKRKKVEQDAAERKNRLWNFFTFKYFRRSESSVPETKHSNQFENDNEQFEDSKPWTIIDYAIFVVKLMMWVIGQLVFNVLGFGIVYFTTSLFALIWLNLGTKKRQQGELSAYSVFNENCQNIEGTLTGEQFDAEIRHKKLS